MNKFSESLKVLGSAVIAALLMAGVASAATTITTSISTGGTLTVSGASTLTGLASLDGAASTTNLSTSGAVWVGGMATTTSAGAISTRGSLTVGSAGTAASGMVFGYCNFANVVITATTTGMITCSDATGILSGDRIFVQATTSLPTNFRILHASSTESDVIQIQLFNHSTTSADTGSDATGTGSINFWGVR